MCFFRCVNQPHETFSLGQTWAEVAAMAQQMFPPHHQRQQQPAAAACDSASKSVQVSDAFADLNFWRTPLPVLDLDADEYC